MKEDENEMPNTIKHIETKDDLAFTVFLVGQNDLAQGNE